MSNINVEYLINYLIHHYSGGKIIIACDKKLINDVKKAVEYNLFYTKIDFLTSVDKYNDDFEHDVICVLNANRFSDFTKLDKIKAKDAYIEYNDTPDYNFEKLLMWVRSKFTKAYLVGVRENLTREVSDLNFDDKNKIELSVIFPVYNVEKYLKQCIETCCKWDAPFIEFLFVDDGSKDNSSSVILEAAKKDKRIKLLQKENGGCASARQYGLDRAKGRFVGFIDPDDFIDPTMFRKLLFKAFKGNYDITWCGYNEFYNSTKTVKPITDDLNGEPYTFGTVDKSLIDLLVAYRRIAIWRGIYKREFLEENNLHFYTDIKRHDDLPFKVETFAMAKSVASVNEYLYYYRLEREGQDVSANDERLYVHIDIFKHLNDFFSDKSSQLKDYYEIVKRDTNDWVLKQLKKELRKDYKQRIAKTKATLSIILPFYNASKYILNFYSLVNDANCHDVKFIFVNDGSTDGSCKELKRQMKNCSNVSIISQNHKGVSKARNLGLKKAKTDYVWFVDIDDNITVDNVRDVINTITNHTGYNIFSFSYRIQKGDDVSIINPPAPNDYRNKVEYAVATITDYPYVWNKVFSIKYLRKNRIFFDKKSRVGEDAIMCFNAIIKDSTIFNSDKIVYEYNVDNNSVTGRIDKTTDFLFEQHMYMVDKILNMLEFETIEENHSILFNYFNILIGNSVDSNRIEEKLAILENTLSEKLRRKKQEEK